MRRTWTAIPGVAIAIGLALVVAASQRPPSSGGFVELHRARLAESAGAEIVMGLIERDGESRSSKHHHPHGEFGFVVSGTIIVTTEHSPAQTLEAGDSFYQPPGEWHVVGTGAAGAQTVVFRVIEPGEPMVVPVE